MEIELNGTEELGINESSMNEYNFEIDVEKNEWVKKLHENTDPNEYNLKMNSFLSYGYSCVAPHDNFQLLESIPKNPQLNTIQHQMNNIQNSVYSYQKTCDTMKDVLENNNLFMSNAANRGKIGESYVEEIIKEEFPNITIKNTTGSGHEGDLQLQMNLGEDIMIEIKNYSRTVPGKEVEKFYQDMNRTQIKWGIFYSLASPISHISKFSIKKTRNCYALIIPECGFRKDVILLGLQVLFIQMEMSKIRDNTYQMDYYERTLNSIYEQLERYIDSLNNLQRIRYDYDKMKSTINNSLEKHSISLLEFEKTTQYHLHSLKKLVNDFSDNKDNLKFTSNQNQVLNYNEFNSIVEEFHKETPYHKFLLSLIEYMSDRNVYMKPVNKNKTDYTIIDSDKEESTILGYLQMKKTKAEIRSSNGLMSVEKPIQYELLDVFFK